MPDILSSAPALRDVDIGGGWSTAPHAIIICQITDDFMREEINTSSLDAADPEKLHAQFDMASASQTRPLMPDDISSAPALCDVGTGGK